MSFKSIVRELKEMRDGFGSMSRRGGGVAEARTGHGRGGARRSWHPLENPQLEQPQGRWANLPPELLFDVIQRLEASEVSWPARRHVVACAAVCRPWRDITKEVVRTPEQCGRITFPISLKQGENDKFLLAARKNRRTAGTEFVISLASDDFSRASSSYIGKLRSNFLGTKFTVYDSQPPSNAAILSSNHASQRIHSKQVSPRVPAGNYNITTIAYELNVLRTRGPRRMHCTMHSIPVSAVKEGGTAPTPTGFIHSLDDQFSSLSVGKGKEQHINFSSTSLNEPPVVVPVNRDPLVLKNKSPRWHEQLQCWCLNFRGRVTVASVKKLPARGGHGSCLPGLSSRARESNSPVWKNRQGHLHNGLSLSTLNISGFCDLLDQL